MLLKLIGHDTFYSYDVTVTCPGDFQRGGEDYYLLIPETSVIKFNINLFKI